MVEVKKGAIPARKPRPLTEDELKRVIRQQQERRETEVQTAEHQAKLAALEEKFGRRPVRQKDSPRAGRTVSNNGWDQSPLFNV